MKKLFAIFILFFATIFSGCNRPDNASEESSSSVKETMSQETEKEIETKVVLGDVKELAQKEKVFSVDASEETENYVRWKNSAASAQLDVIGGWDNEVNCSIKYESAAGSISEIKLYVQLNRKLNTEFYEADINCDGSNELVIVYTVATGTAATERGIYVYDFKNDREIKPVGEDGVSFTAAQESDIFEYYKKWYDMGITEFSNIKDGAEGRLPKELFKPYLVDYNGQPAIKAEFMRDAPEGRKGISIAVICYENGEFVVKEVWFQEI